MIETIKSIILDFQEARLETGVPRRVRIETVHGKAAVCIGVRRSGKSTYMFQMVQRLLDSGVPRQNILYLNCFDDRLHTLHQDHLGLITETYYSLYPEKKNTETVYCFFDEIQAIPGWERFVDRVMRTEQCEVYLTGSSAKMLSREIATQMRGRALSWELFPFSFREFLDYKGFESEGVLSTKRRLFGKLRAAFPQATLRVHLDGGFASPRLFDFLEAEGVEYIVAMASNTRLEKRVRRLMGKARMRAKATGRTAHLYGETRYAARHWSRKRRVVMKAEVVRHPGRPPKNNPRFVVTNLPDDPQTVYACYCQRGDMENRLKELHHGLAMDRISCSRFLANQFRVLLTLAAYILFQALRRRAAGTGCADAQVSTLRERLLKLGVWVERTVRRIVLHLPTAFPWLRTWRQLACAVRDALTGSGSLALRQYQGGRLCFVPAREDRRLPGWLLAHWEDVASSSRGRTAPVATPVQTHACSFQCSPATFMNNAG